MIKRYDGNTGRVSYLPEAGDDLPLPAPEMPAPPPPERPTPPPPRRPGRPLAGLDLGRLLPGPASGFEMEDLLLLLILYLLYRESGDEELLFILGAMFLL